jgi:hypothetical protein
MSKYQIKFIRRNGNQYIFEVRGRKLFIEDMVASNGRYSSKLSDACGVYGWSVAKVFISLTQAENACGECLTTNEWFIENMKSDPKQWGRSATKQGLNLTVGILKIVDRAGVEYRVRAFTDKITKDNNLTWFAADIRRLSGYCLELGYN